MSLSREKARQVAKRTFRRRHVKRARRQGEKETDMELADWESHPEPKPLEGDSVPHNNLI
jgi:hypothetical protein